jgi:ABC-type transport system involved in multi-copper enzyme maturation permease subunit
MNADRLTPTSVQVAAAIARREITMALRRKLVKLLFLGNLIPPLVMAIILIVNMVARGAGFEDLEWDPLARLLQIQTGAVLLLALGIGTPLVARDRSEDVLFLYATRPVTPWSYTFGKMMAVAVPAVALLVIPAILIAILRTGLMEEFGIWDSLLLIAKIVVVSLLAAWGFSGITVGPSAATKKARWALLLAFACLGIPNIVSEILWSGEGYALSAGRAIDDVIATFFDDLSLKYGVVSGLCLVLWGALGAWVTAARVRREMIP